MLLQSLILVFLKVSISNSYPLEDNFELVGNGIDSIGAEEIVDLNLNLTLPGMVEAQDTFMFQFRWTLKHGK